MTIQQLLEEARRRIAVTDDELTEARRRRGLVADALRKEFGGRVYYNGSVAHGDANDPLTDFDAGIVVPDPDGEYGPGAKSADELKERVRTAVRVALADEFPGLRVEIDGHKRSVVIRFSSPVSDRSGDLTGDVIVALDHPDKGLYIPRFQSWDRSDPEEHTRMMLDGNARTSYVLARAIRLLKHWSGRHDSPLCSWHIKVLALEAITGPVELLDGLAAFFDHAFDSLGDGDTPDPAGVGPDISPRVSRTHARDRLAAARDNLAAAREEESDGRPLHAQARLANVFPDIVDRPTDEQLAEEERQRAIDQLRETGNLAGVGAGAETNLPNTRAWRAD